MKEKRKCVVCGEKPYGAMTIARIEDAIYIARVPVCKKHYKLLEKIAKKEEKRRGNSIIAIPYELIEKEGITIDKKAFIDYDV